MQLSRRSKSVLSADQRRGSGEEERVEVARELSGRALQISSYSCSMSIVITAQRIGAARIVARSEAVRCSEVKICLKSCELTLV